MPGTRATESRRYERSFAFCQSNFNYKLVMSHKERHLSNCKMRTVSFVEHLEFEITGNVFSKAIALGDVDNDQVHVSI